MSYCCSQCNFTARFESALKMHSQLHHGTIDWEFKPGISNTKSNTLPRASILEKNIPTTKDKNSKLTKTSSATRLFDKLRMRICRSKTLFAHPEEGELGHLAESSNRFMDLAAQSDCTSKAMKEPGSSVSAVMETSRENKETFACHLCAFDSDRITVLDRHLLNDHKIGLDILLKLVMAKTKDGLAENNFPQIYGIRQPYYKPSDEIIEDGEFVIETVTPKIKILKHTATNTYLTWKDIPDIDKYADVTSDIDIEPTEAAKDVLFEKINTLSECMSKFVDSSNNLKKVLNKEFDYKKERTNDGYFNLGLGDQDTPRDWERAHSEKSGRHQNKCEDKKSDKMKVSSDSFYF